MKLPPRLAALVVKDGVSLGLLAEADRALVLALAATAIEAGREHREADMNRILEAWLDGPGAMLRTDHVELRRWLVDAGFVSRDGFGRAYVRGEAEAARAIRAARPGARRGAGRSRRRPAGDPGPRARGSAPGFRRPLIASAPAVRVERTIFRGLDQRLRRSAISRHGRMTGALRERARPRADAGPLRGRLRRDAPRLSTCRRCGADIAAPCVAFW